jgi:Fe-S cluster assembly protein SufD
LSLVKSEALDKPLVNYKIGDLKALADSIPVQKYGDSPTIRHYTDWRKLLAIKNANKAAKSTPGLLLETFKPSVTIGPEGVIIDPKLKANVVLLTNNDDYVWRIPVENKLQAIHSYRWFTGASITVRGEQDVSIYLSPGNGYVGYHLEINVEDNSKADIVIGIDNSTEDSLHSSSLLINVGSNSQVSITTVEKSNGPTYHYKYVKSGENSVVNSRILASGGEMTRLREDYILSEPKATVVTRGSSISKVKERLDLVINTIHLAPSTTSELKTRGIVSGHSVVAHRGVARVNSKAEWSSVDVESFLYITSNDAKAYSVPVLEVDTGIVDSARHSTAVMNIPEDIEFYLRQRGFTKSDIIRLISLGLLEVIAEAIDVGKLEKIYL